MKRKLWTLLLALGAALALCVGASATEVSTADALTGDSVELNGEYKLIADITIDRSIVINKEKSVTLDLNGHVLNLTDTSGGDSWITVEGGGNLTITDSSPTVPHNFEPNADGLWVLNENGTKSVTGGVITGGTGYQYRKVQPNGTVYIVKAGGGVFVKAGGKLTMEGGNIVGCSAVYGGGVYVSDQALLTLKDQAAIRNCSAKNTAGGVTHGGGIFVNSGSLTIEGSAKIGENCTASIGSGIYMEAGFYFLASQNLCANGGVIAGEAVLNNSSNYGATLKITGSGEDVTEFKGSVLNNGGIIEKGNFTGKVTNNGTISGGEFTGTVANNGSITGGKFTGTVINGEGGTIAEGVSITKLKFIVTFDNEGTRTTAIIDNGGKLTAPAAPTKEGYRFDGWYYDNSGSEAKWVFGTDTVTRAMTLKAKWVQTYTVTFETNGGSAVDPVTVDAGSTVSKPADPARSGYAFDGWYTENTYENPYDFHAAVTGSLTLYAKWNSIVYSDPTYAVSAPTAENGKIAVSPRYAERGERVTVTLTPDEGFELESLTVTDSRGNELTLTDKGDGRYTFTMPARRV